MPMTHVNGFAVIVAAAVTFALGAVWYSPLLFAKRWIAAQGESFEQMRQAGKKAMARRFLVSVACYIVTAYVLSLFASYMQATTVAQGLWLGFLAWLGFAATSGLVASMFSPKPLAAWVIDAGYQLTYLLIMGVLVTLWR